MTYDAFVSTAADNWYNTDNDQWIIDVTVSPSAQTVTWAIQAPSVRVDDVETPSAFTATWSIQAPTLSVAVIPSAQSLTWSTETPTIAVTVIPSAQTLTWSAEAVVFTKSATVSPSSLTATWSVETPTVNKDVIKVISSALSLTWALQPPPILDSWSSTADDKWANVEPADRWFGITAVYKVVSPTYQTLTWSLQTPTINLGFDKTVYVGNYLTDEAGDVLFEEDGITPLYEEDALEPWKLTWAVQDPTVKFGRTHKPNYQTLTWSLQSSIGIGNTVFPDAQTVTWAIQTPTISIAVAPSAQTLTWSQESIGFGKAYNASAQTLTWGIQAPVPACTEVITTTRSLTWSLKAPSIITESAANVTVSIPDPFDLTWEIQTPTVAFDFQVSVSAQTLTWSLETPGIDMFTGSTRKRGYGPLLGVYRNG